MSAGARTRTESVGGFYGIQFHHGHRGLKLFGVFYREFDGAVVVAEAATEKHKAVLRFDGEPLGFSDG